MGGLSNGLIPIPTYPRGVVNNGRPQIKHIMSRGVVDRPDHHCGDDLVFFELANQARPPPPYCVGTHLYIASLTGLQQLNYNICHRHSIYICSLRIQAIYFDFFAV